MNQYQQFIHKSRYARFIESQGRRENWDETVKRYMDYFVMYVKVHNDYEMDKDTYTQLYTSIYKMKVMPSMRAMMTAGKAADRDNISIFNCSYVAIDNISAFSEALYILMCGTGLGFSVERQFISKLPIIPNLVKDNKRYVIRDSKLGWAQAFKALLNHLYDGKILQFNFNNIRPSGSRLKTFGGRASGPEPLKRLFAFVVAKFKEAQGRKLNSLECHEIMCMIGDIVVAGGVRRSAEISLSNLSDERMRACKSGNWYVQTVDGAPNPEYKPYLRLANNSVAYTEVPDVGSFMDEWVSLYRSKSGERGIFSRIGAQKKLTKSRRDESYAFGTNPCGEILLRSGQFCNLTEVVVTPDDTKASITQKVVYATILGTLQATNTNFSFLRKKWEDNTKEEALLGVSMTGIWSNDFMSKPTQKLAQFLSDLKKTAIDVNIEWARKLKINPSAAITTIKPSGTVSQLVGTPSGIHPPYGTYYIRNVRQDRKDPLTQFLIESGFPCEVDQFNKENVVFSFPIHMPARKTKDDVTAVELMELIKFYNIYWSEHAVSCTVSVREHEWPQVGGWVYDNFNYIIGMSFLPFLEESVVYTQLPFQKCNKREYSKLKERLPEKINWDKLRDYEEGEDNTTGTQEYACVSGACRF